MDRRPGETARRVLAALADLSPAAEDRTGSLAVVSAHELDASPALADRLDARRSTELSSSCEPSSGRGAE